MAHILVVDDDTGITTVIREMLTRLHYDVLTAKDGKEALEKLALGPVDLVVTDIIMPEMDGIDLIIAIQRTFPRVRIIAMSGGGAEAGPKAYLKSARQLGAAYCLPKPFMIDQLAAIVSKALSDGQPVPGK
ncbi:MAG: response regulator [Kiritimatiellales bacterium]|jgi:CheY-like chemotaxis protein